MSPGHQKTLKDLRGPGAVVVLRISSVEDVIDNEGVEPKCWRPSAPDARWSNFAGVVPARSLASQPSPRISRQLPLWENPGAATGSAVFNCEQ